MKSLSYIRLGIIEIITFVGDTVNIAAEDLLAVAIAAAVDVARIVEVA